MVCGLRNETDRRWNPSGLAPLRLPWWGEALEAPLPGGEPVDEFVALKARVLQPKPEFGVRGSRLCGALDGWGDVLHGGDG